MQTGRAYRWQPCLVLAVLLMLSAPGWGQAEVQSEMVLNGITINTTFIEVLSRLGLPHYIGPSVSGASDLANLLRPPAPRYESASTQPRLTQPGISPYGVSPGAPPYGATTPGASYGTSPGTTAPNRASTATAPQQPLVEPYMVWQYNGNGRKSDPKADFTTYVFFNEMGVVKGVTVHLNNLKDVSTIRTESGITFGTRMSDVVKIYGWPEPFSSVGSGSLYYCSYPSNNVTFAVSTAENFSRRVVCISVGLPVAVTAQVISDGSVVTAPAKTNAPQIAVPAGGAGAGGALPPWTPVGGRPPIGAL